MPTPGESSTCRPPSTFISLRLSVFPLFLSSHPMCPSSLCTLVFMGGTLLLGGGVVAGWVRGLHKASGCYPQPAGMPGPGCRASLDTGEWTGGRRDWTVYSETLTFLNRLLTLKQCYLLPELT